jgi:hypothetical protein
MKSRKFGTGMQYTWGDRKCKQNFVGNPEDTDETDLLIGG